jgi:transposase
VDEEIDVPLPGACPKCEGKVVEVGVAQQFQTDLPPPPPLIVRRFWIHIGECGDCGCRVQPRHALQTSDALGAAAVQLGPRALGLGTQLNKAYGLSWGKAARFTAETFGLQATRATYCRASLRMAKKLEPTYEALIQATRKSPIVTPDETGWLAGGRRRWLWTFVGLTTTVYAIAASRGGDVVRAILGADYSGRLVRDGWAAYRCLTCATHQTCLGHLLHRCHEILEVAKQGQAKFPHAVRRVLQRALDLRDRREEVTPHGFASLRGKIEAELDWLLTWRPTY